MESGMNLEDFRARVRKSLGRNLEDATPDRLRAFIRSIEAERRGEQRRPHCYEIEESGAPDFDAAVRSFLDRALSLPAEQAAISLWLVAADLLFAEDASATLPPGEV
jgi:hypothetical protein